MHQSYFQLSITITLVIKLEDENLPQSQVFCSHISTMFFSFAFNICKMQESVHQNIWL